MSNPSYSWDQFRSMVADIYRPPGRAPNTHRKMVHTLALAEACGIRSLDELTTSWVAGFVQWRAAAGVSSNTIRGDLSYLAAAASIAVEEGLLAKAPSWRRIRPRPGPRSRKVLHSIDGVRKVLELLKSRSGDWAWHRLYALAVLIGCAGLRKQEALRLQVRDVCLDSRTIDVVERDWRLKTLGSEAKVPMCPELAAAMRDWLPWSGPVWLFPGARRLGPWTGGKAAKTPGARLKAAGEEAGVEGLTLSSLRHTFATWSRRRWGLSALQLRDVLRHSTEHTQSHYVHEETDRLAFLATVERVGYLTSA